MLPFSNEFFTRKLFTNTSLPRHCLPCPRETHFWYIVPDEVTSPSLLNQYLNIISPCERRAVLRINGAKQQKCALLTRALVRTTLSRYMPCKIIPQSLSFSKNRYGKPQVGIDIEDKQRTLKHDVLSFARRFFSPKEVEFLLGLKDPVMQHQECIKLWTLKEAYVKALGRGFSAAPFRNFTLRYEAKDCIRVLDPRVAVEVHSDSENLTENWEFAMVDLSTHYGAICVEKAGDKEGEGNGCLMPKVWKTIPFIEDERIF